jgi:methylmalonyl-CoA mutase N-terminal domain/subunit
LLSHLKVHFFLNADLLADIALLRAFKTLWYNYIKAYKLESIDPKIILGINHDSYTEDENNDLIMATILCMSGAISGVESILIAPKESVINPKNTMRLLLNIQNIMKLESNMSTVNDALAGSYALETATERIVKKAWEGFE